MTERRDSGAEQDPRVYLAAERTLLAWIRTGVALMGFGFVVARFGMFLREVAAARHLAPVRSYGVSLWVGVALVVLGVFVNGVSAVHYAGTVRRLRRGDEWEPRASWLGIATAGLLALLGAGMAVFLLRTGR